MTISIKEDPFPLSGFYFFLFFKFFIFYLVGKLEYISPEETGRTGRNPDFKSDLYSLGKFFKLYLIFFI